MATRLVRITYEDGTVETFALKEAAFGVDGTEAHGPVKSTVLGELLDDSDGSSFPSHNRLSLSLRRAS